MKLSKRNKKTLFSKKSTKSKSRKIRKSSKIRKNSKRGKIFKKHKGGGVKEENIANFDAMIKKINLDDFNFEQESVMLKRLKDNYKKLAAILSRISTNSNVQSEFKRIMCQNKKPLFGNMKREIRCATGSFKVVTVCDVDLIKTRNPECKYVFSFDFSGIGQHEFNDYRELDKYRDILNHLPLYKDKFKIIYGQNYYEDDFYIDVLFSINKNLGLDTFDFMESQGKYKKYTYDNLWLSFNILITCLYSLSILHNNDFIHGDIKLENIMIGNVISLTDYGTLIKKIDKNRYYAKTITPDYVTKIMAQTMHDRNYTFDQFIEYDLHALGIVILTVLCGLTRDDRLNIPLFIRGSDIYIAQQVPKQIISSDDGTFNADELFKSINERYDPAHKDKYVKTNAIYFPRSLFDIMSKNVIKLLNIGFKDNIEGPHKEIATKMFNDIINDIKALENDKQKYIVDKYKSEKIGVKLHPDIINKIKPTQTEL